MNKKRLESYEAPITQRIDLCIESGILTVSGGIEEGNIITGDAWDPLP